MVPVLLSLSPAIFDSLLLLLSPHSKKQNSFNALHHILHADKLSDEDLFKNLNSLVTQVKEYQRNTAERLLSHLADVHLAIYGYHVDIKEEDLEEAWFWTRENALKALQQLISTAFSSSTTTPALIPLILSLRHYLLNEAIPEDTNKLSQRLAWVESSIRQFEIPYQTSIKTKKSPWDSHIKDLLAESKKIILELLQLERKFILTTVRPFISMVSCPLLSGNKIKMNLGVEAEGNRQLQDVTIILDAKMEQGIMSPGELTFTKEYESYPAEHKAEQVSLEGFIKVGQKNITLMVTLVDNRGYTDETIWTIPIPKANRHQTLQLDSAVPALYQRFKEQVFSSTAAVALAVCDEELGYSHFISDWDSKFPQQRLDLDHAVQDIGAGRKYSATKLDTHFIQQQLEGAKEKQKPLLLAPMKELLLRLIDTDGRELEAFCQQLALWANSAHTQPLILLVNSEQACSLRRKGLKNVDEIYAHQVLIKEPFKKHKGQLLLSQLIEVVCEQLEVGLDEAHAHITTLGYDCRLVLKWLVGNKKAGEFVSPTVFINSLEVDAILENELQALEAIELIHILVASQCITQLSRHQVVPGHIAAENHYSTTRSRQQPRKLIQAIDKPFSQARLDSLSADIQPPNKLKVRGFGTRGASNGNSLLNISQNFSKEERAKQLQQLALSGFGTWLNEIFSLGSPYQPFIQRKYQDLKKTVPESELANALYKKLRGEVHNPLEVISSTDLLNFSSSELQALMPTHIDSKSIKSLRIIADLWQQVTDTSLLAQRFRTIFITETVVLLHDEQTDRWDKALLDLGGCIGIGEAPVDNKGGTLYPHTYVLWLNQDSLISNEQLSTALATTERNKGNWLAALKTEAYTPENFTPRIIVTGPGSSQITVDKERKFAVLNFIDFSSAVWEGNFIQGIWRKAQVQLRLTAFSPFKTSGALPPESNVFRGRQDELEFLQNRCREASVLIIGSRRVGKTSLLNQFYAWASKETDLEVIMLDLQGIKTRKDFLHHLKHSNVQQLMPTTKQALNDLNSHVKTALETLSQNIANQSKLTLFLFNEVDGLAGDDPELIEIWRSLNDAGLAHFIMTGYAVIGELGTTTSAFFHFTEGTYYDRKAIALMALTSESAESILDLLENSDLKLTWASQADKQQAYQLLLARSYRIPWVLQSYARLLVEDLEKQRSDKLSLTLVKNLLKTKGNVVWQYIESINYQNLGYQDSACDPTKRRQDPASRKGFLLLLYALARKLYFLDNINPVIRDKKLEQRNAIDLGFTIGEVYDIAENCVEQLPIDEREKGVWLHWLKQLDLAQALRFLTLTLILEPDPSESDRYAFLLHIFPLELYRQYGEIDPKLDDLLMKSFGEFLSLVKQ